MGPPSEKFGGGYSQGIPLPQALSEREIRLTAMPETHGIGVKVWVALRTPYGDLGVSGTYWT